MTAIGAGLVFWLFFFSILGFWLWTLLDLLLTWRERLTRRWRHYRIARRARPAGQQAPEHGRGFATPQARG